MRPQFTFLYMFNDIHVPTKLASVSFPLDSLIFLMLGSQACPSCILIDSLVYLLLHLLDLLQSTKVALVLFVLMQHHNYVHHNRG